jgi:hypothetical protein
MKTYEEILNSYLQDIIDERKKVNRPHNYRKLFEVSTKKYGAPILWLTECFIKSGDSLINLLINPEDTKLQILSEAYTTENISSAKEYLVEIYHILEKVKEDKFELLYDDSDLKIVEHKLNVYSDIIESHSIELYEIYNQPIEGLSTIGSNKDLFNKIYKKWLSEIDEYIEVLKDFNNKYNTNVKIPNILS